MADLQALKKKAPGRGGTSYDDIVGGFVALVMAKLLAQEFEPAYVFARHQAWKNGPWTPKDGEPVPSVAIGTAENGLTAAVEIETPQSLVSGETPERWKRLAGCALLDLVVPKRFVDDALTLANLSEVQIHDVWSYTIDAAKKVAIVKETASPEALVEATKTGAEIVLF